MIENSNSTDNENIKSNNEIKESKSTQNLLKKEKNIVMIYPEKLNNKNRLSFLYLILVYNEIFIKNYSPIFHKKNKF